MSTDKEAQTCMCGSKMDGHPQDHQPTSVRDYIDAGRPVVLNPEVIGDPNQTPIVQVQTDDDCPMHSRNWLYKAVRNNRRLSDLPPQDCACDEVAQ